VEGIHELGHSHQPGTSSFPIPSRLHGPVFHLPRANPSAPVPAATACNQGPDLRGGGAARIQPSQGHPTPAETLRLLLTAGVVLAQKPPNPAPTLESHLKTISEQERRFSGLREPLQREARRQREPGHPSRRGQRTTKHGTKPRLLRPLAGLCERH